MTSPPDDESRFDHETRAIVLSAQGGQRDALEDLYLRVAPALYSWTYLRMSPAFRARIDPQDIVQEVWLRAITRIDDAGREESFRSWLFGVARFVLIEMSRKLPRGAGKEDHGGTTFFRAQPDPATGASTRVARTEAVDAFLTRVQVLTEDDRELVVMRGLEGRPFEEIAARLGRSADTLGKRWQRLRERLSELGPPEYLL